MGGITVLTQTGDGGIDASMNYSRVPPRYAAKRLLPALENPRLGQERSPTRACEGRLTLWTVHL